MAVQEAIAVSHLIAASHLQHHLQHHSKNPAGWNTSLPAIMPAAALPAASAIPSLLPVHPEPINSLFCSRHSSAEQASNFIMAQLLIIAQLPLRHIPIPRTTIRSIISFIPCQNIISNRMIFSFLARAASLSVMLRKYTNMSRKLLKRSLTSLSLMISKLASWKKKGLGK